jgi:hypothetical protein
LVQNHSLTSLTLACKWNNKERRKEEKGKEIGERRGER